METMKHQQVIRISLVEKSPEVPESVHSDHANATVGDIIIQSVSEYCDYSSIIGLKYLVERKRPFIEK